jgi:hypothetical protein
MTLRPSLGLSQTSVIAASIIVAYIVFVTVRGELPYYISIFTGKGQGVPISGAGTPGVGGINFTGGPGGPGISVGVGVGTTGGNVSVGVPIGGGRVGVSVPVNWGGSQIPIGGYPQVPGGGLGDPTLCAQFPELCPQGGSGSFGA